MNSVLVDDSKIMELISSTTLVGVLPVPHSIVVRRYIPNAYTNMWFTTYVWGVIFLRHQSYPLMDGAHIRMFTVSQPAPDEYDEFGDPIIHPDEQANVVADDLPSLSSSSSSVPSGNGNGNDSNDSALSTEVLAATATAMANVHGIPLSHAGVPSGGGPIV